MTSTSRSDHSIALVCLCTGKYHLFLDEWVKSAVQYLPNADLFVLADQEPKGETSLLVSWLPWGHMPWPHSTLHRHRALLSYRSTFERYKLLVHTDVDMTFVSRPEFPTEGIFAVSHPGYQELGARGPFETRGHSAAYVPMDYTGPYVAGGVQGGIISSYLEQCMRISAWIDRDMASGIIPTWHDESYWNRACVDATDLTILPSSYCSNGDNDVGAPVLIALDKDHRYFRATSRAARVLARFWFHPTSVLNRAIRQTQLWRAAQLAWRTVRSRAVKRRRKNDLRRT